MAIHVQQAGRAHISLFGTNGRISLQLRRNKRSKSSRKSRGGRRRRLATSFDCQLRLARGAQAAEIVAGVVRGPRQGRGRDHQEALGVGELGVALELVGRERVRIDIKVAPVDLAVGEEAGTLPVVAGQAQERRLKLRLEQRLR